MDDTKFFTRAFNHGYILQEKEPTLALAMVQGFKDRQQIYAEGFIAGTEQKLRERQEQVEKFIEEEKKSQIEQKKQGSDRNIELDMERQ